MQNEKQIKKTKYTYINILVNRVFEQNTCQLPDCGFFRVRDICSSVFRRDYLVERVYELILYCEIKCQHRSKWYISAICLQFSNQDHITKKSKLTGPASLISLSLSSLAFLTALSALCARPSVGLNMVSICSMSMVCDFCFNWKKEVKIRNKSWFNYL